jgi:8-oxo-dGTP pyrophosphatase MutT (NUDIX family)
MTIDTINAAAAAHRPVIATPTGRQWQAAVALVACPGRFGPELLFIERARNNGDPWSGHLAFPGGRTEPADQDLEHTARRETHEELGIHLELNRACGRLDDLVAVNLPVVVSAFVYTLQAHPVLQPNAEVEHAFSMPLQHLVEPERRCRYRWRHEDCVQLYPALDLLGPDRPVLWGMTYRLTAQLLELCRLPRLP